MGSGSVDLLVYGLIFIVPIAVRDLRQRLPGVGPCVGCRSTPRCWSRRCRWVLGIYMSTRKGGITLLSTLVNFGALSAFLVLRMYSGLVHYLVRERSRDWWRHLAALLVTGRRADLAVPEEPRKSAGDRLGSAAARRSAAADWVGPRDLRSVARRVARSPVSRTPGRVRRAGAAPRDGWTIRNG